MEFILGKNKIRFNEDFKPKSLDLFVEMYSNLGSKEELTKIFDKLNGNTTSIHAKSEKPKRKSDSSEYIQGNKKD